MKIIITYPDNGKVESVEIDMDEAGPGYEEVIYVDGRRVEISVTDA